MATALRSEELAKLKGHRWQIACLEFSPDGSRLASGAWDKEVRLWDLSTLETETILKDRHASPVTTVSWFQPDGSLLAVGSADFTTSIWNATNGEHLLTLREHFGWVLDSDFSGNGSLLATASWDKTVRVWDPATGVLLQTLNGHTKGVFSCHFHPVHTSAVLCTASDDETIRIWDARVGGKPLKVLVNGHDDAVTCCRWSSDASLMASGSADTKITMWEPREGKPLYQLSGHEDAIKNLAFNPSGSNFLLASVGDSTARLWDPQEENDNEALLVIQSPSGSREIESVAVSPDGSLLATGGRDNVVTLTTLGNPASRPTIASKLPQHVESFRDADKVNDPIEKQLWRRFTHRARKSTVKKEAFGSDGELLKEDEDDSENSSSSDDEEEDRGEKSAFSQIQLKPVKKKTSVAADKGDRERVTGRQLKDAKKVLRSVAATSSPELIQIRQKRTKIVSLENEHDIHISAADLELALKVREKNFSACQEARDDDHNRDTATAVAAEDVYDDVLVDKADEKKPVAEDVYEDVRPSEQIVSDVPLASSSSVVQDLDSFDLLDQLEEAARKEAADLDEELGAGTPSHACDATEPVYDEATSAAAAAAAEPGKRVEHADDNDDPLYSTIADTF